VSYCLRASCLAHHATVFWHHQFNEWVHTDCHPCEALAGEPDPTELHCWYCGAAVQLDGGGRLLEFLPDEPGQWGQADGRWVWHDNKWTQECPVSPTYHHEDRSLSLTRVKSSD
jgi:hypothetical protein